MYEGDCFVMRCTLILIMLLTGVLHAEVTTGLDTFQTDILPLLQHKRVAVVTNVTAVNKHGEHLLTLLKKSGVRVTVVFTPEHGFFADKEGVGHAPGNRSLFVPLYGKQRKPDIRLLKKCDIVLYDIQDVGARYYTYITTMVYMMRAAAQVHRPMIIVERPNMVGNRISGFQATPELTGYFTSVYPIPTRYGMTNGALARFFNRCFAIGADLTVIPLHHYRPDMLFNETGLPWVNPSPNITSLSSAVLYSELGWLESTNLSMGRGTEQPFHYIGAPFIDGKAVLAHMPKTTFKGVRFVPVTFIPKAKGHKYCGKQCGGVKVTLTDLKDNETLDFAIVLLETLLDMYPDKVAFSKDFSIMVGSKLFENMLKHKKSPQFIKTRMAESRKKRYCVHTTETKQ